MFESLEIDCPTLAEIGSQFSRAGEFYSAFFRPVSTDLLYPNFGRGNQAVLADVLDSHILNDLFPFFVLNNREAALDFTILNRYEFEGSLLNVLLEGTCTERVVRDEAHAREVIKTIFEGLFPASQNVCGFRMDGVMWSNLAERATLAWAYFAYASASKYWWFVSFADFY